MKKILCPVDFSEVADNAVAYAAKLAQAIGGSVTLFNVQSMFELTPIEVVRGQSLSVAAAAQRLAEKSQEVTRVFKVSCTSEVEPSVTSLSKLIERKSRLFDLIVVGSNGPDDYYQFFSGSNAYHLVRASRIPVLIVPEGCTFEQKPLAIYAFDYLKKDRLPMKQLAPFAKAIQADLFILNVAPEKEMGKVDDRIKGVQKELKAKQESDLILNFETLYQDEVVDAINNYVTRNSAAMLALCTEHKSFIERLFHKSVIKRLAATTAYPMFVFHE